MTKSKWFAVDPGSTKSGVVEMSNKFIVEARIMENDALLSMLKELDSDCLVLYEDIFAYSNRLGEDVINTIKFIGVLEHEMRKCSVETKAFFRWQVKKFVFDQYRSVVVPRIELKIEKKNQKNNDGKDRRPSHVYVDDRIVVAAMKSEWSIPTPKPGKKSMYNLAKHSWQALAVATTYMNSL